MAYELQYLLLLSFLLTLLPFFTVAQTYNNISLGSSLTAQNDNSFWVSPSGDFAFGFKEIGLGGFLLAIWFNKIPERTIVWSANGQNLAPKGSKVELTVDGSFLLNDPTGKQIWNASSASGNEIAYAAMLDTGNFVLVGQDSQYVWESSDQPTDTILPGQVLNQPARLVSRYLENNYSSGRFQFKLQKDGNLVLYTTHFPLDAVNFAYWTTQVFGSGFSLVFNQSGYIFLQRENGSIINMISSNGLSTADFYQRAILENDGVFRHYVYPKSNGSRTANWPNSWTVLSFIPSNMCLRITEETGSGACGFNSYCMHSGRKSCHCPLGYSFIDPNDEMKGCKQDFVSQSCDEASPETDLFDFNEMLSSDWPLSDYEYFESVTENWCRQACLGDCFCATAIFRGGECWKKKLPLSNGRFDPSDTGKALVKIRKDNSTLKLKNPDGKDDQSKRIIIVSVFLSSSVLLNLALLVATFLVACRFGKRKHEVSQSTHLIAGMNLRSFTYQELSKATNGFKEELGQGAFATVYKGAVWGVDGRLIAVKRLDKMVQESEEEFKAEMSAIGQTNHRNLVQLLGFCDEGEHRLLVYEFMSKGSLASFLFDTQRPSWNQRIKIALGTARGLLYLHEECSTQIIHCDIKPQNILLDENCTARISDFGLAKLLKTDQNGTTTAIRGTKGYVAPEWFKNMPITVKVDVYSYGVLLLELICCRRSFEMKAENENQKVLTDWAYDCLCERTLGVLLEDDEEALDDMKNVEKYVMIAIWCIQEEPSLRPTMKKVLQMLEGSVDVPIPPDPPSFSCSI